MTICDVIASDPTNMAFMINSPCHLIAKRQSGFAAAEAPGRLTRTGVANARLGESPCPAQAHSARKAGETPCVRHGAAPLSNKTPGRRSFVATMATPLPCPDECSVGSCLVQRVSTWARLVHTRHGSAVERIHITICNAGRQPSVAHRQVQEGEGSKGAGRIRPVTIGTGADRRNPGRARRLRRHPYHTA